MYDDGEIGADFRRDYESNMPTTVSKLQSATAPKDSDAAYRASTSAFVSSWKKTPRVKQSPGNFKTAQKPGLSKLCRNKSRACRAVTRARKRLELKEPAVSDADLPKVLTTY